MTTAESCPLCAAWTSTIVARAREVPARLAHCSLVFGFWLGKNAGASDDLCADHREQLAQLDAIFSVPTGG